MTRSAGILLHPTALPGGPAGDLGPAAERFLDWLRAAGLGVWQVLPLHPPALGASPYTTLSAFAANPLLISLERLAEDGLLSAGELGEPPASPPGQADFAADRRFKEPLLRLAGERFAARPEAVDALAELASREGAWFDDWCLFAALRERFAGAPWQGWPAELARREPAALDAARRELAAEIRHHAVVQLFFARQWERLRAAARERGVRLFGDLPVYVALDSADVWAHPELFDLDEGGQPRAVAGFPPDYFAADGQLWGNPLYRWDRVAATGYRWWIDRLARELRCLDLLRLDHFRGFVAYWRVPAGATTAIGGEWVTGPGRALFDAVREALGALPLVAEDLGEITPEVETLRRALGLPGMKILQFAFAGDDGEHAPHRHEPHAVVYPGTHDNDTAAGWYAALDAAGRDRFHAYAGPLDEGGAASALTRLAFASVADLAVVPMQDVLGLGSAARTNVPGRSDGNWTWRLEPGQPDAAAAGRLRRLAALTGRLSRG